MPAILRANEQKQLVLGLTTLFGLKYKQYPQQWTKLFEANTTDRSYVEELKLGGFGAAQVKPEGAAGAVDVAQEAWSVRYTPFTVVLQWGASEEAIEDNLYESIGQRYTKALARSFVHTKEAIAASFINRGFTGSVGGDGVTLFNTAHPLINGGSNPNRPSTTADLNEASLDAARITISKWVDERGLLINATPVSLHIPTDLAFTADKLTKTVLAVGTANNDINPIQSTGMFPGGVHVNNRFSDPRAWFIKTDVEDGLKMFQRIPLKYMDNTDFNTGNFQMRGRERYVFGCSDPLGVYGVPGA